MQRQLLCFLLASLGTTACSNTMDDGKPAGPASGSLLDPPAAGSGTQLRMVTELGAGVETERCQFFQAPPEGMNVRRAVIRYSPGSHHVLLYGTPYSEVPTVDINGNPRDTSGVIDCPEGAPADWQVTGILAAAQSPKGANVIDLPDGIAVRLAPNQVMLMNAHYLNTSNDTLHVDARINVETVPAESVREEAGVLFFYNPFIHVPGNSRASARMSCPLEHGITLFNGQSHMHRRGVGYEAVLRDAQGAIAKTLYTGDKWEDVRVEVFAPALAIPAGYSIDYRCDYQNDETREVFQGLTTRDEMCMFVGAYYPRNRTTELCGLPGMDQTYIGTGTATCAETVTCLDAAGSPTDRQECVVASCPGNSKAITDLLGCNIDAILDSCAEPCADPLSPSCASCAKLACAAETAACQAASCG
jgi:hypothetical protein